ncbi:MAG: paraquat-inducible protein A [Halopseudomonas sp.]
MQHNNRFTTTLTACHQCDLLMHRPELQPGSRARCPRCGATVAKALSTQPQRHLALILTGLIMLWPALGLPMLTMELLGQSNSANLIDSVIATWSAGYPLISVAIALFCLIIPALLLILLLLLQCPWTSSAWQQAMLKLIHHLREWSMLDIYLLGLLVSIVKVSDSAGLSLGPGLFCFVILMISLFVALTSFNADDHWQRLEAQRGC